MNTVITKLESYKQLEYDWDGYGAIQPINSIIDNCISFCNNLSKYNTLIPNCMISGSGEVGIYWELINTYIEVTFNIDVNSWILYKNHISVSCEDFDVNIVPIQILTCIQK